MAAIDQKNIKQSHTLLWLVIAMIGLVGTTTFGLAEEGKAPPVDPLIAPFQKAVKDNKVLFVPREPVVIQKSDEALLPTIQSAQQFLSKTQQTDGGWATDSGPAITAMLAAGLVNLPTIDPKLPIIQKSYRYVVGHQKPDGGIYDEILLNYNTSLSLMALARVRVHDEQMQKGLVASVRQAQGYLRSIQWGLHKNDPAGNPIDKNHPYYGGQGYGRKGRPDLSNTAVMIASLKDSGLNCKDPAYVRAMAFISQLQGVPSNTTYGDRIEPGGGFIYSTSPNKDNIGKLETKAGELKDAQGRSRLRTYGSMTYAGFMSYLYAEIDREDPRVIAAMDWLKNNYTLEENPGVGMQGYYYYLHLMARALDAWGEEVLVSADGKKHHWRQEIIARLVKLQRPDGSWLNTVDRWSEGDPHLCTAYALLALQYARAK